MLALTGSGRFGMPETVWAPVQVCKTCDGLQNSRRNSFDQSLFRGQTLRNIPNEEHHAMLRCCCCLLLHANTRAARASSHLVWDAQTSVWALALFQTFSLATIELGGSELLCFISGETSRGISNTFFLILGPPSGLLARFRPFRCHH